MENFKDIYVKKLYAVNKVRQKKPIILYRSDRALNSLVYKTSGRSIYRCNGKEYVSDKKNVVLLCKNQPYELDCIEPGLCLMIEFDSITDIDSFYSFAVSDIGDTEKMFREISKIWTLKEDNYVTETLAMFYNLLHRLLLAEKASYSAKKRSERIHAVTEYIGAHYSESDLSNEKLAEVAGMSVVYFRKLFTEIYAVPPMQYVFNIRMEKAKELLLSDYCNIEDIAEATGYMSIYSFSRAFKRKVGVSPTHYVQNKNFNK